MSEIELILTKLKIVSEEKENGMYLCDKENSKILLDYIYEKDRENQILKHRLNDIVFDDANDDVELGARFLRKIGYVDFDEERNVYINKHNKEPFWQEDEREKGYYIPDEELDEYTKQLENQLQQKENIIKEVREKLIKPSKFIERAERLKLLEILDKEGK